MLGGNPIGLIDPLGLDKQYSIGISGTAFIPTPPLFAIALGIGGSISVGVSTDNTLLGTQFYAQLQENLMLGTGVYIGGGSTVSWGETECAMKSGWLNSGISGYAEVDGGLVESFSYARNFTLLNDYGNSLAIPKITPGFGVGFGGGVGLAGSINPTTPTIGNMLGIH